MMRALVLALALTACAQTPAQTPPTPVPQPMPSAPLTERGRAVQADMARLDRELHAAGVVAAGAGETADLGGGLTVRPLAIIEDSRCPADVTCIWAGRMRIRASISGRESELELGQPLQTPNGTVLFAVASPGAWSEWPSAEIGPRPASTFGFRRG